MIDGIRSWITVVVQTLANGVRRCIHREPVEPSAFGDRQAADYSPLFRDGVEAQKNERPQPDRRALVDREFDLDCTRSEQLHSGVDSYPWIPPTAVKDYEPRTIVRELTSVQTMSDRKGQVQVTPRPGRGRRNDRLREV